MEAGTARTRSALAVGLVAAVLGTVVCLMLTLAAPDRPRPRSSALDKVLPPWAQCVASALAVGVAGFAIGFGVQSLLSRLKPETRGTGERRLVARSPLEREISNVEEIAALCVRRACRRGGRGGGRGAEAQTQAKTQRGTHTPSPHGE